jgi:hypothetical protein
VNISLGVVGLLVLLVDKSILCSTGSGAHVGPGILSDILVRFLGGLSTRALNGL